MNRIYFLLIFIASPCFIKAQQYQLDSVVQQINGAQFIAAQRYDAVRQRAELIRYKQTTANAALQYLERAQIAYDDRGNERSHVFSVWNPTRNAWDEEEKTDHEYGADNKLTRISTYRKTDSRWTKVFENTRRYAADSIIETDYEKRDDSFLPIQKSISIVNTSGKVKTHKVFQWSDNEQAWQPFIQTTNHYQRDSILIAYETLSWQGNTWHRKEKAVYDLDADHERTDSYTLYRGQDNHWIPITKFEELHFPASQKKVSRVSAWSATDKQWESRSEVETYLNKNGKKQDVLFSEVDSLTRQLKLQVEQMHLYDKNGRLTLFQDFFYSGELKTGTQNTVKFDERGNVVEENMYALDPEKQTWVEQMTTELVLDENIPVDLAAQGYELIDWFGLSEYRYNSNKYPTKQVKIYRYDNGAKVLSEEFTYFYSLQHR